MDDALRAFAEDPAAYVPRPSNVCAVDTTCFFAVVDAAREEVDVSRIRLLSGDVAAVVAEIRELARGARVTWSIGASATPRNLEMRLRELGACDPEPPLEPVRTALVLAHEPPRSPDFEIRRVETFEDFLTAYEIETEAHDAPPIERERLRRQKRETYERRRSRPGAGGQWLGFVEGRPAGYASAIGCHLGFHLAGGAVLPWARGRGLYGALVRARWEAAVEARTPALVVDAGSQSRPILERLGFEHVCEIRVLVDSPA